MVVPAPARLPLLLEELKIRAGDLIYLHTSFSRLGYLELSPDQFIDELLGYLGPQSTVVVPSFAWHLDPGARPWKGYADYYRIRPTFDVARTRSNIGVIPETFRRRAGARRSLDFWWSVAALGPLAESLTEGQEHVLEPYGPDSSFGRLHQHGVTILALGVSLNTTSLAPVVDQALGSDHTGPLFSTRPEQATVIDCHGHRMTTEAYWLLPEVVRWIKPSRVIQDSGGLGGAIRRVDRGEVLHFAYSFDDYFRHGVRLGRESMSAGRPVPWLEEYAEQSRPE